MKKILYLILLAMLTGLESQAQSNVVYKEQIRIENQPQCRQPSDYIHECHSAGEHEDYLESCRHPHPYIGT